jgi:hypothetical protein
MEIINRICEFNNPKLKKKLDKMNISYEYDDSIQSIVLEINENDAKWLKVKEIISKYDLFYTTHTSFSQKEIDEAEWLILFTTGHFGYPQPEDSYFETTYNLSDYCKRCGMGAIQNNPFHLKTEPKHKRSHFLQLNWIFDEFFIQPEVKTVFEKNNISGVEYIHPVFHKSNEPIYSIFQLKVNATLSKGLVTKSLNTVTCIENNEESHIKLNFGESSFSSEYPYCKRIKYHYPQRDMIKLLKNNFKNDADIIKSHEYFGSGCSAHKLVIISQKVYEIIKVNNWRGISVKPIKLI